jgi:HK97 family phage portal protein
VIVYGADGSRKSMYGLFDSSTPIPRPSAWGATISHSGERISMGAAAGLPAFMRGIRLISETAAGLPWMAYKGHGQDRKPQPKAPQLNLLRRPNPDAPSAVAVWQYVYVGMLGGNAYIYKVKVGGKVTALYPINPAFVTPKYEGNRVSFDLRDREHGPVVETVGKDRIIHIPGILLDDPYVGVSVVNAHRHELGNELGRQRFEGRYLANDARPGTVLKHTGPGIPTKEQRAELRGGFESTHRGTSQAGTLGMVWGGWDIDSMPISMQDAQFIESKRYGVQDIGRMLGIPSGFLNDPDRPGEDSPEEENTRLIQHGVAPWMTRLEQALASDIDLFPTADWSLEMDERGFYRANTKDRYDAYRLGRQGGWVTANEIRNLEGLPAVKGGDEIQQTPVGGAANNASNAGGGAENGSTE